MEEVMSHSPPNCALLLEKVVSPSTVNMLFEFTSTAPANTAARKGKMCHGPRDAAIHIRLTTSNHLLTHVTQTFRASESCRELIEYKRSRLSRATRDNNRYTIRSTTVKNEVERGSWVLRTCDPSSVHHCHTCKRHPRGLVM